MATVALLFGFQSTRPARGATITPTPRRGSTTFQSTRPARGATPQGKYNPLGLSVSIHAPRAGRDVVVKLASHGIACFNPRAPRGARRRSDDGWNRAIWFQSTRPARGATGPAQRMFSPNVCFNPRAPRGARHNRLLCGWWSSVSIHAPRAGRDPDAFQPEQSVFVSIHAPRAGRDSTSAGRTRPPVSFNPRAPRGARHETTGYPSGPGSVSIHAPRAGRDRCTAPGRSSCCRFNPRAPRGARPLGMPASVANLSFQSTRPARGATSFQSIVDLLVEFQSTRPARGATTIAAFTLLTIDCFNPRAPRGARRPFLPALFSLGPVSIHAPRAGRDLARR